MARSSQTTRPPAQPQGYIRTFQDHAGQNALRLSTATPPQDGPPQDFTRVPKFCFQVYSSVELDLEADDDQPAAKRARGDDGSLTKSQLGRARLLAYLADLSESQRPDPIWDVYVMPGKTVLDFVDHSRREIRHRKQQRLQSNVMVPLIPRLVLSPIDGRKSAFLFAIDNVEGLKVTVDPSSKWEDKQGPIWVHFDDRLPDTVTSLDRILQLAEDPDELDPEDEAQMWSVQIDTQVQRIQQARSVCFDMSQMYRKSYHPSEDGGQDSGLDFGADYEESVGRDSSHAADTTAPQDSRLTVKLVGGSSVVVSAGPDVDEPDIRYTVYARFLKSNEVSKLEEVAQQFGNVVHSILGSDQTFELCLRAPSEHSDASILTDFRQLNATARQVGVLTEGYVSPDKDVTKDQTRRRLHPTALDPHIFLNDPLTSMAEAYKDFIIIIDRPDFTSSEAELSPAIRFLLADGGENKRNPTLDYVEMQAWRSPNMEEVVRRMTMDQTKR